MSTSARPGSAGAVVDPDIQATAAPLSGLQAQAPDADASAPAPGERQQPAAAPVPVPTRHTSYDYNTTNDPPQIHWHPQRQPLHPHLRLLYWLALSRTLARPPQQSPLHLSLSLLSHPLPHPNTQQSHHHDPPGHHHHPLMARHLCIDILAGMRYLVRLRKAEGRVAWRDVIVG
ncbi:hypothetical protein H0H92_004731 [Tricholoma furcatifolium]|nr:hypothetical protein H0H92_004731 [Tricholoma furcatifolium]